MIMPILGILQKVWEERGVQSFTGRVFDDFVMLQGFKQKPKLSSKPRPINADKKTKKTNVAGV